MTKVYLLWALTSDQYGIEELVGVYSSREKANGAWVARKWEDSLRVETRTIDGPLPEKFQ